ncbi:hypothetical protein Hosp_011 [Mycobacterium phage Hosp]|uniref:hypothetical protein n=1 Tax=Mycobacterium phage 39HC TaxID=1463809 RepID=UPI0003F1D836|nr:hypothetical protein CG91_gp013 [Mycobacterium phage 39HC]YP_009032237.1 hypothetical protein FH38_gp11 [Mycobacterium phage Hosp]AHJ88313.1 hypothetical protein 39HC_013 [Mycobacterium phage 39HC]AHJ88413.1 hypothetical protein 40BC_013 [Mycobacterium phage 40BC]AHK11965.1 hypothetical protein Hosp_011 [Mycobacterium phage Hosp]
MNQAERLILADKLAAEHTRLLDFVRTATVLLGLLPLMYGGLTWVYGEKLWAGNIVYGTAMGVPWAPQSWGTVFVILGVGTIVSARMDRRRCVGILTMLTALMLSMFMVTFLVEVFSNDNVSALPPALVYGVVSLLFMGRARLAWAGRVGRRRAFRRWKGSGG